MEDFKVYQTSGMLNFLVHEASDVRKPEQTLSGDIVSFTADAQFPMKIVVDIDSTGWTGCAVNVTGKNLWIKESADDGYLNGNGDDIISPPDAGNMTSDFIPVDEDEIYSYTSYPSEEGLGYWTGYSFYSERDMNSVISGRMVANTISFFFRVPIGAKYIRIGSRYLADGNAQLEKGYDSTELETVGRTIHVTFPNEISPVFDGTLTIDYDGAVALKTGGQKYPLTSISPIETIVGDNNIWADAGPVSVTYPI